ncbi:MAG TPA: fimbria/pilus periplasmic chaperone [Steroidobacteraceae bacterium]|nr:fimbria/pilus periplasmic chaperone [Steroidobacteraceae bacterium]
MKARALQLGIALAVLPLASIAGSLRVGPTRIDLSPRHPVAVLEVQNTGDTATLTQVDTLVWKQDAGDESLEPTPELIATPLIMTLAPGETQKVRVGLREPNSVDAEQSYRVIVGEVVPTFVASTGLRFAVRVSVPVFAAPNEPAATGIIAQTALSWSARPGTEGCERVLITNTSQHHDHVIHAELLAANGEVLWESAAPDYVLAGAWRTLRPEVCAPVSSRATELRLTTENRTITLPPVAAGMLVDAHPN